MADVPTADEIRASFHADLARTETAAHLQALHDQYLGRKRGAVQALLKAVAAAAPEARRELGQQANRLRQVIEHALDERRDALVAFTRPTGSVDVTLPGREVRVGHRHPLTLIREEIERIFVSLGFEMVDGPEVEDDYHNFEALNMPPEHPARDMQDTLYLASPLPTPHGPPGTLLRTHTSGMQIRYMETHDPPVRIIAPGLVYRRDTRPDALADVPAGRGPARRRGRDDGRPQGDAGVLPAAALRAEDARDVPSELLPLYRAERRGVHQLRLCGGSGCAVCKQTGWLEILGSGMVDPAVLEAVGYDPERLTGWAFGIGIDRIAILKYRVQDIRAFYDNDLRLLEQFAL